MQMTTAADWALEAIFPDPFGSFVTLLGTTTELSLPHLIPLGCVAPYDYHTHLLIVTLGPLAFMLACGAGGAMLSRLGRTEWSQRCYSTVLLVSFITLPTASTTLFRTFHCEKFDNGAEFLIAVSLNLCPRLQSL